MNKKYLMRGFAALALVAGFSSCVKDVDGISPAEEAEKAKENAELQLGLNIPDGQTWDMAAQISANVAVNLNAGETYEVAVYANDPIADGVGKVLAKGTVQGGKTYTTKFTGSKGAKYYVVGVTDSKNFTRYTNGVVEDGHLVANFGASSAASRSMRAITVGNDTYSTFNFPTEEELADVFPTSIPEGAEEIADLASMDKYKTTQYDNGNLYFIYSINGGGHNYKVTKTGEATIGGTWDNDKTAEKAYNVYVSVNGNVTLKRSGTEYMNLYILSGNVTIDSNFGECGGIISVAAGATVNDQRNHVAHNGGIKIFNRGTFNATNTNGYWNGQQNVVYDIGNKATIYNQGTFEAEGAISYSPGAGNTSYFINMGDGNDTTVDLKADGMYLNSTCHFYTAGTVEIDGPTYVTQSGIVWINNGHYTTETMKFSANNGTFYNYCQLIVEDECDFTDGKFNMMTDSYAKFGKGVFNNFYVTLANNSTFYVEEGALFGLQQQGSPQGFYATDNNAIVNVLLAGETKVPAHNGAALHISGAKLNFSYEDLTFYEYLDYFSGTWDGTYSQYRTPTTKEALVGKSDGKTTWEIHDGASYSQKDDIEFTAPEAGQCSATVIEKGKEKIEEPAPVTFAFEDQISNGDYDLNDVVLKITPHVIKTGKKITGLDYNNLDIKLVAAGATFDITVMVDETALSFNGKTEVHDAFGVNRGVMVNTGGTAKSGVQQNAAPVTCTIATPEAVKGTDADGNPTLDLSKLNIWIDVNPGKTSAAEIYYLKEKTVPYAVMIPNDWAWPKERVCIKDAYVGSKEAKDVAIDESGNTHKEDSFSVWAATLERNKIMNTWFNYPVPGSTMNNTATATAE